MRLTNGDIWGAQEPLKKLIEQRFPVMVSYKLAKLVKKLDEQFRVIEEVRVGLIKKYGEAGEKGNMSVNQDGENFPKFVEEFNELMAQEVDIKELEKVKLPEKVASTCDKCHHNMDKMFEIEPNILIALDKLIEVG